MNAESDDPVSVNEALGSASAKSWKNAMLEEFRSLQKSGTFEIVDRKAAQDVIDTKWVFTWKTNGNETVRHKARLVG